MRDLVTLMLAAIALAWCADHVSFGPAKHDRRQRLIVCTLVIIILLAGFAGLRTRCNDTGTYRYSYKLLTEKLWEASDKSVGSNPLFNWVNYRLKMHGVSTQNFLMFWAFLTVGCYFIFVHKYSVNYPLTIFYCLSPVVIPLLLRVSNRRRRSGYRSLRRCLHLKRSGSYLLLGS